MSIKIGQKQQQIQTLTCSENDLNNELLNHYRLWNEIQSLPTKKESSQEELVKRDQLFLELLDSMNKLVKYENFIIQFKNNQIINQFIWNSYITMISAMKKSKKKILLTSLVYLLKNSIQQEDLPLDTLTTKNPKIPSWIQKCSPYLLSIEKNIRNILDDKQSLQDDPFNAVLIDLIDFMFGLCPMPKLLTVDFPVLALKFLRQAINENNSISVIAAIRKLINTFNDELIENNEIKYYSQKSNSTFTELHTNMSIIINDYEQSLIKYDYNVVGCLILSYEFFNSYIGTEIQDRYFDLFDRLLKILDEKIDNFYSLTIQGVSHFNLITESLIENKIKDPDRFNDRGYRLLELMAKILIKSEKLNLNIEKNIDLVDMALNSIYNIMITSRMHIKFDYFYLNYWNEVEKPWSKLWKHEKGAIAFKIFDIFALSYIPDQLNLFLYLIKSAKEFLKLKVSKKETVIEKDFQSGLAMLLKIPENNSDSIHEFERELASLYEIYFNFGINFNFNDWCSSHAYFSQLVVSNKFKFIFNNQKLSNAFFNLTMDKIRIFTFDQDAFKQTYLGIYFFEDLAKIYANELSIENKYQLMQVLDFLSFDEDSSFKERTQNIITTLLS